jgi:hypothetical protein
VTNLTGTASININGTVGATTPSTGNFTVLTELASPVVVQTDIGSAPNEIPLNQYLGNLAYQDAANIAGPVGVGGSLTVVGATTLNDVSMSDAGVNGYITVNGGISGNQLLVNNFAAASSAMLSGGSTNLVTYSEQFDNAAWTKTRSSITANETIAPDGLLTGDNFSEDTTTGAHTIRTATITSAPTAAIVTATIYVRNVSQSNLFILYATGDIDNATYGRFASTFDLSNGTIAGNATANGAEFIRNSIFSVGNGWYRCSVTGVINSTGSPTGVRLVAGFATTANASVASSYLGTGASVYIWGAQLNAGDTAPYLKTVANAVTTAYAAPIESPNGLAFPLLSTMSPARNADMTFELASNTSLVVKVRGSDGTVRSATLTLA